MSHDEVSVQKKFPFVPVKTVRRSRKFELLKDSLSTVMCYIHLPKSLCIYKIMHTLSESNEKIPLKRGYSILGSYSTSSH